MKQTPCRYLGESEIYFVKPLKAHKPTLMDMTYKMHTQSPLRVLVTGMGGVFGFGKPWIVSTPTTWQEALNRDAGMLWVDMRPAMTKLISEAPNDQRERLKYLLAEYDETWLNHDCRSTQSSWHLGEPRREKQEHGR